MKFVCSVRFDDGSTKPFSFSADNEMDACWEGRDIAEAKDGDLVNVWHARNRGQNRR